MSAYPGLILAVWILAWTGLAARAGEELIPCEWTNIERVVAVGDIHGDYQQFVRCLTAASLIDGSNNWVGGKAHLVQTGDRFGRGKESKKVLDLIMSLEPQAEKAGGGVHPLIGNHEVFILTHHWSYMPEADVAAYGGPDELAKSVSATGRYGKWMRSHNAIIRINDSLFCHAGLTSGEAGKSLRAINDEVRRSLAGDKPDTAGTELSVFWTRSLATDPEESVKAALGPILDGLGAKRIVVGHTVSKGGIRSRAGGMVIMIDVGMSAVFGGPAMCLAIENGRFFTVCGSDKKAFDPAKETDELKPAE